MANKFPKLSPNALSRLRAIPAAARAHRFWFVTGTTTLLLMAASFIFGYSSLQRVRVLRAQEESLVGVLSRVDRWVTGFRPTTPAESLVWTNSTRILEELAEGASDPATVAAEITARAERVGIEDVSVHFLGTDSTGAAVAAAPDEAAPPPRSLGGWTLEPRTPPLLVEFEAGFEPLIAFINTLPPHVEARELRVTRSGERVRARFTLLAYRATRS